MSALIAGACGSDDDATPTTDAVPTTDDATPTTVADAEVQLLAADVDRLPGDEAAARDAAAAINALGLDLWAEPVLPADGPTPGPCPHP